MKKENDVNQEEVKEEVNVSAEKPAKEKEETSIDKVQEGVKTEDMDVTEIQESLTSEYRKKRNRSLIKLGGLLLGLGGILLLIYFLTNPTTVHAPKEKEDVTASEGDKIKGTFTINGKEVAGKDLYKSFLANKEYIGTFADYVLMENVLPTYGKTYNQLGKKEVNAYVKEQQERYPTFKLSKAEKARMSKQHNENEAIQQMYSKAIGNIDKEAKAIHQKGFIIGEYVQVTMKNKAKVDEIKKKFYGIKTKKAMLKFIKANQEGNEDYIVDVLDYYDYNVTEGMKKFLKLKVGEYSYLEGESYYMMVKKVDERKAGLEEVKTRYYSQILLTKYGRSHELLAGINGKYKDFKYNGNVAEFFKKEKTAKEKKVK